MNKNHFSNIKNKFVQNFSLSKLTTKRKEKIWSKSRVNNIADNIRIEPLSFSQQQMWIIDQMRPGNHAYNLPVGFQLKGDLIIEILEKSLNEIIKRHETLRTTFGLIDNQPKQLIHPECLIKIKTIDLSGYFNQEIEIQLNNSIREEVTTPFDLTELPLIRAKIFKLSEDENIFLLNIHHIITDGWSTAIIFGELSKLYNNYLNGCTEKLPDLPIQYSDYVNWQLQKNWNPSYDEQLEYWKEQLDGELPNLELLSYKQRPPVQSLNGSNEYFFLSKDLTQKIQSIGVKKGCSFFMTMLAVFQVFLNRYTGINDIIIGTPVSNRPRKSDENLIGNFLNIVALRNNLSDCPDFTSLLKHSQKITLDALKNRDLPFEKIVEHLRIERDLSRNPVFQVMIQVLPKYSFELSNLTISSFNFDLCYSQFDLSLHLYQVEDGYNCRFEYDTDLFDSGFIRRMTSNFKKLSNEIISDPLKNLNEYSVISEDEFKLLKSWNETDTLFPEEKCFYQLFEEQAEKRYDYTAAKFSNDYLTYAELNSRANKLATT